jgi:hypothetical protein
MVARRGSHRLYVPFLRLSNASQPAKPLRVPVLSRILQSQNITISRIEADENVPKWTRERGRDNLCEHFLSLSTNSKHHSGQDKCRNPSALKQLQSVR